MHSGCSLRLSHKHVYMHCTCDKSSCNNYSLSTPASTTSITRRRRTLTKNNNKTTNNNENNSNNNNQSIKQQQQQQKQSMTAAIAITTEITTTSITTQTHTSISRLMTTRCSLANHQTHDGNVNQFESSIMNREVQRLTSQLELITSVLSSGSQTHVKHRLMCNTLPTRHVEGLRGSSRCDRPESMQTHPRL